MHHKSDIPEMLKSFMRKLKLKIWTNLHEFLSTGAFSCAAEDVLWTFCCKFCSEKLWCSHDNKKCVSSEHLCDKKLCYKYDTRNLVRRGDSKNRNDCWVMNNLILISNGLPCDEFWDLQDKKTLKNNNHTCTFWFQYE